MIWRDVKGRLDFSRNPTMLSFAMTDKPEFLPDQCGTLTLDQLRILRDRATEPPGSSVLLREKRGGVYVCAGCQNPLYEAQSKFESGTGWPSFGQALPGAIATHEDFSHGMIRVEVVCARCHGHLGHVFPDGPPPTGLRYCMNGLALKFVPET